MNTSTGFLPGSAKWQTNAWYASDRYVRGVRAHSRAMKLFAEVRSATVAAAGSASVAQASVFEPAWPPGVTFVPPG